MSQQSQGKRKSASQASLISNYFKRIESSSTQKSRPTPSENAPSKTAPEPQHPVADIADEDPESNDVERTTRTTKRRRLITPPISSEPSRPITPTVAGERNALTALMNPNVKEFRPPPESPRTARYKYTGLSTANAEEPSTPEQIAKKKSLHEKFVAKLGRPESMALFRRKSQGERQPGDEEEDEVSGEGEEEEEEAEEVSVAAKSLRGKYGSAAAAGKKTAAASKKSTVASITKFTPLERQYMEIKKQYPDTLLLIEVGYKFRFFGEDAKIASKELGIAHFMSHNFFTASIPVPRLHIHVKRLVTAGHKVGVVRQTETAALKAVGDNRSAPFERKLTNLYTKGTYIDDFNLDDDLSAMAPSTGYIMCIVEDPGGGSGTDEKVNIGMVAVQPSTGDVVYDEFEDGFMRGEFETRALHLQPGEIIVAGNLSNATKKVLSHLSIQTHSSSEAVRTEYVARPKTLDTAKKVISTFYTSNPTISTTLLEKILSFPRLTLLSLSTLLTYIIDFGLQNIFNSKYFTPFSSRASMLLNGSTLASLEIYRNQTDFSEKGSLLWVLDHTRTKFGRRMLRKWIGRPLLAKTEMEARLAAVEEIKESTNYKLEDIGTLLSRLPDLEKGLVRIHYGRCTRPELLSILQALSRVASKFPPFESPESVGFNSPVLNAALYSLPTIATDIVTFLSTFNHNEAAADNKFNMFREDDPKFEAILENKMAIAAIEADLDEHLLEIRKMLKHSKLVYVTVAGIEASILPTVRSGTNWQYLVELRNTDVARVPKNWVKMSGTKTVSRFHSPQITKFLQEREQQKESLAVECDRAYSAFLREISEKYEFFRDVVQNLGVLDCLLSLATVASLSGYTKPEFVDDGGIEVMGARHPMVEQILVDAYVPNDIQLKHDEMRALILTGPNMGGKSCYIRSVALISIMAQIGSYVPCDSAKLTIIDGVYTRMGAFDNMLRGESTFMYEMNETAEVMKTATSKSLVVLDEIGRGTATFDGLAIAQAVLRYFVEDTKCLTLFVTHYPQIREIANEKPLEVGTFHMGFMERESQDGSPEVTFLYKLTPGIAHRSYGLNVASLANLPPEVISIASEKARILEEETKNREMQRWNEKARDLVKSEVIEADTLIELAKRIAI